VLDASEDREINRRALRDFGADVFRPAPPPNRIHEQLDEHVACLRAKYAVERIRERLEVAATHVNEIRGSQRRRELFHGKAALEDFYKLHLSKAGMSRGIFAYEAARHARRRKSVTKFFDEFHRDLAGVEIRAA
jgi:hypothetical protein